MAREMEEEFGGALEEQERAIRALEAELDGLRAVGLGSEAEERLSALRSEADGLRAELEALGKSKRQPDTARALFETWKQQRRHTERVAAEHPLRLLPMYHYEPRRYIVAKGGEDPWGPFEKLATPEQEGLYVGFKMYSSQGYMPADPHPNISGVLGSFFSACASRGIPIMTHCTPSGFYTHERTMFLDYWARRPEASRIAEKAEFERYQSERDGALRFFKEKYLHPEAWRPVLSRNSSLRLCLAHFASNEGLWDSFEPEDLDKPELSDDEVALVRSLVRRVDRLEDRLESTAKWHLRKRVFDLLAGVTKGTVPELSLPVELGMWGVRLFQEIKKEILETKLRRELEAMGDKARPAIDSDGIVYARNWVRGIVSLCMDFPNFYTDLSYLIINDPKTNHWRKLAGILKARPKMMNKIMFGTDWYMNTADTKSYAQWFEDTIGGFQKIQDELGTDENLFYRFAIINPMRFYRLTEIGPKLMKGLEAEIRAQADIDQAKALSELRKRYRTLMRLYRSLDAMDKDVIKDKRDPLRFGSTP